MKKKTQKMTLLMTVFILLTSMIFIQNTVADTSPGPHAVKGMLYINGEIAEPGIEININFTEGDESNLTFEACGDFNFNIGFNGYEDETGDITVMYMGQELVPIDNDTVFIPDGAAFIYIDLSVVYEIPPNNPPAKPMNPSPADGSTVISTSTELSVDVSDPDDDSMKVEFYDASDDSLIGTVEDVANGGTASVVWSDLAYDTEYCWYAVANDSELENKSDDFTFTTEEEINISIFVQRISFGRVCARIKNKGETNLTNVEYEISMEAGLLKRVIVSNNGSFENLTAGKTEKIFSSRLRFLKGSIRPLCFGKANGHVVVKVDGKTFNYEFRGRVISKILLVTSQGMVEE